MSALDLPLDLRDYYRRMEQAVMVRGYLPPYPIARPDEVVEAEHKSKITKEPKILLEVTRQDVLALVHAYDDVCQMAFVKHGLTEAAGLALMIKLEYWESILRKLPYIES